MKYREETTVWDTPNHTYITEGSWLLGYVPRGSQEITMFMRPKKLWSTRGRTFRNLTAKEVRQLTINNIPYNKPV